MKRLLTVGERRGEEKDWRFANWWDRKERIERPLLSYLDWMMMDKINISNDYLLLILLLA